MYPGSRDEKLVLGFRGIGVVRDKGRGRVAELIDRAHEVRTRRIERDYRRVDRNLEDAARIVGAGFDGLKGSVANLKLTLRGGTAATGVDVDDGGQAVAELGGHAAA